MTPSTCTGGSRQSSAHWGISQPTAISFSPPSPGACPSPGKCGMIRFSILMSPDSIGNISFSAFCGAEPGMAVRVAPGDPSGATPSSCSPPCYQNVLAGPWDIGRNLPGEHRDDGSSLLGAKDIEALAPMSFFQARFSLGQFQLEFTLFFHNPSPGALGRGLVPTLGQLTWNSYISVNRR